MNLPNPGQGGGYTPSFGQPAQTPDEEVVPDAPVEEEETDLSTLMASDDEETEAEQVESDDEESGDPVVEEFDGRYSRSGEFSRSDVVAAIEFSQNWTAATQSRRDRFSDMMNVYGNQAEIMFGLYPSNGRIGGLEFISSIHNAETEGMTRMQLMRWGMEFSATISDMSVERTRMVTKMINALTPDDYPEIRYRSNMSASVVSEAILEGIGAIDQDMSSFLEWSSKMLDIWPGRVQ